MVSSIPALSWVSPHGLRNVERRLDLGWDGLDLSAQLLLNLVKIETVVIRDEVDGQTQVPKAPRAPNTMEVGLTVLGEIKVDHHIHGLDVNSSGEQI